MELKIKYTYLQLFVAIFFINIIICASLYRNYTKAYEAQIKIFETFVKKILVSQVKEDSEILSSKAIQILKEEFDYTLPQYLSYNISFKNKLVTKSNNFELSKYTHLGKAIEFKNFAINLSINKLSSHYLESRHKFLVTLVTALSAVNLCLFILIAVAYNKLRLFQKEMRNFQEIIRNDNIKLRKFLNKEAVEKKLKYNFIKKATHIYLKEQSRIVNIESVPPENYLEPV